MNNKSDFYKKTYSEKIDTSNIKKTRNNNRNNGDYRKVEDIYVNSTGIYKIENIENNNKYNNASSRDNKKNNISSKLLFLLCVGGLYAYINNTNPIIIKEIGDNFNKLNLTGIISKGVTLENISNLGNNGINKIKEVLKIDDLDIKDNIGENIAPVFNINGLGIGEDNNNNLDININNDVVDKMNDEINKINNTNFIINNVDEIKEIDKDENNEDDEDDEDEKK